MILGHVIPIGLVRLVDVLIPVDFRLTSVDVNGASIIGEAVNVAVGQAVLVDVVKMQRDAVGSVARDVVAMERSRDPLGLRATCRRKPRLERCRETGRSLQVDDHHRVDRQGIQDILKTGNVIKSL